MDIKIEKKPWYIRYKFYIAGGIDICRFPCLRHHSVGRAAQAPHRVGKHTDSRSQR